MDWKTFCQKIERILVLKMLKSRGIGDYEITEDKIDIWIKISDENESNEFIHFIEERPMFEKEYGKIKHMKNYIQIDNKKFEMPVLTGELLSYSRFAGIRDKIFVDEENKLKYSLGTPSNNFILKMIELTNSQNRPLFLPSRLNYMLERRIEIENNFKNSVHTIYELLKIVYRSHFTIQIISENELTVDMFQKLADAYIFNINYNFDLGVRQDNNMEILNGRIRDINLFRHERVENLSVPKKIYKRELTEQYNMANISEDPFIQYICYYHILEHFYEDVYKKDLIQKVRQELTTPEFSVKKDKSVQKIIDTVKGKNSRNNMIGNELESLELVLKEYIDIEDVKTELEDMNQSLIDYYTNNKVPFSDGDIININDQNSWIKNMANRIYKTRNSLVHYKSNELVEKERGIYRPFKDNKDLKKEIPLMRILAEQVILNAENSELIDI